MAQRTKIEPMTAHDWLALSADETVLSRIKSDPYSMAYPALVSHFAVPQAVSWDAAILGLHVVYGWMPTIPKLGAVMRWGEAKRQQLTEILNRAKNEQVPTNDELEMLKAFSNNSMIGASKLLHFLSPKTFPIWDSRVAKVFLRKSNAGGQQVNGIEPWEIYTNTLIEWLNNESVAERCSELRGLACFLNDVSNLRLVELVLFHQTASKRKQGQS
jgi:hypothetical protein